MEKPTIHDVAKLAGVSIKTVSRVTNGEASVRESTKEKVEKAIEELNYKPNLAARNLAGTKSYAIGFIYDNPNAYYVIDMQNGILSACRKLGFELCIYPCDSSAPNIKQELSDMVKHSRLAGLVLTPPFSEDESYVELFESLDIDVVRIVSGSPSEDVKPNSVLINDFKASFEITSYLLSLGHKRIGFINGEKEHFSSQERFEGYRAALKSQGVPLDSQLIYEGQYSFESGVTATKQLLSLEDKPSAIFACNDEIAAGTLFAARLEGISVPQQLSIAGFEDSPFSRQTWPNITTAQLPYEEIAANATNMLVNLIRKKDSSSDKVTDCFTPVLVKRDSTAICQS